MYVGVEGLEITATCALHVLAEGVGQLGKAILPSAISYTRHHSTTLVLRLCVGLRQGLLHFGSLTDRLRQSPPRLHKGPAPRFRASISEAHFERSVTNTAGADRHEDKEAGKQSLCTARGGPWRPVCITVVSLS